MRTSGLLIILAGAACVAGCINGTPGTAPSPVVSIDPPTVVTIAVTGLSGDLNPGKSVQLTASATYSDGTSAPVSQQASWRSSDTSIVNVTSTGLATFAGLGQADVTATFRTVTGSVRVIVTTAPSPRFTLTGSVRDATTTGGVANVRVEVTDGADVGRATNTAVDGSFVLADLLRGTFGLRVTHQAYQVAMRSVTLDGPTRLDVDLAKLIDVSGRFGTFNVALQVNRQVCTEPVVAGTHGTLTLSGNSDGSNFRAVIVERGTSRTYNGRMREDGSFDGRGGGLFAGSRTSSVIGDSRLQHDFVGDIVGQVLGNRITGSEIATYGAPCPGGLIELAFSGSK